MASAWFSQVAVEAANAANPSTFAELDAKRSILTDWQERCGAATSERIETLAKLAQVAGELEFYAANGRRTA